VAFTAVARDFVDGFVFGGLAGPLTSADLALARLRPDGQADASFGAVVTDAGASERLNAMAIDARGRIVVAGRKFLPRRP
jgi:hypothetical protein